MRYRKSLWYSLAAIVVVLNIMTCNHAYRFTHFVAADPNAVRERPEDLSTSRRIRTAFTGARLPKSHLSATPSLPYQDWYTTTEPNLHSWWLPRAGSRKVAIVYHGYRGSKSGMINYGEALHRMGYQVLLTDQRGHGGSSGYRTTIGYREADDVAATVAQVRDSIGAYDELLLMGQSMGAVAVMRAVATGQVQPDRVILECPYGTFRETVMARFEAVGVPTVPLADMLMVYGTLQHGFNTYRLDPDTYAESLTMPTLLMWGQADDRVSRHETDRIWKALPAAAKQRHYFPDVGHENYYAADSIAWLHVVGNFVNVE